MLQLAVDLASQIEHDVLTDAVEQYRLKKRENEAGELNAEIQQRKRPDAQIKGAEKVIAKLYRNESDSVAWQNVSVNRPFGE